MSKFILTGEQDQDTRYQFSKKIVDNFRSKYKGTEGLDDSFILKTIQKKYPNDPVVKGLSLDRNLIKGVFEIAEDSVRNFARGSVGVVQGAANITEMAARAAKDTPPWRLADPMYQAGGMLEEIGKGLQRSPNESISKAGTFVESAGPIVRKVGDFGNPWRLITPKEEDWKVGGIQKAASDKISAIASFAGQMTEDALKGVTEPPVTITPETPGAVRLPSGAYGIPAEGKGPIKVQDVTPVVDWLSQPGEMTWPGNPLNNAHNYLQVVQNLSGLAAQAFPSLFSTIKIAKMFGSIPALTALSGVDAGVFWDFLKDQGASDREARAWAMSYYPIAYVSEGFALDALTKGSLKWLDTRGRRMFGKDMTAALMKFAAKGQGREMLSNFVLGGTVEGGEEVLQDAAKKVLGTFGGYDNFEDFYESMVYSYLGGMLSGGGYAATQRLTPLQRAQILENVSRREAIMARAKGDSEKYAQYRKNWKQSHSEVLDEMRKWHKYLIEKSFTDPDMERLAAEAVKDGIGPTDKKPQVSIYTSLVDQEGKDEDREQKVVPDLTLANSDPDKLGKTANAFNSFGFKKMDGRTPVKFSDLPYTFQSILYGFSTTSTPDAFKNFSTDLMTKNYVFVDSGTSKEGVGATGNWTDKNQLVFYRGNYYSIGDLGTLLTGSKTHPDDLSISHINFSDKGVTVKTIRDTLKKAMPNWNTFPRDPEGSPAVEHFAFPASQSNETIEDLDPEAKIVSEIKRQVIEEAAKRHHQYVQEREDVLKTAGINSLIKFPNDIERKIRKVVKSKMSPSEKSLAVKEVVYKYVNLQEPVKEKEEKKEKVAPKVSGPEGSMKKEFKPAKKWSTEFLNSIRRRMDSLGKIPIQVIYVSPKEYDSAKVAKQVDDIINSGKLAVVKVIGMPAKEGHLIKYGAAVSSNRKFIWSNEKTIWDLHRQFLEGKNVNGLHKSYGNLTYDEFKFIVLEHEKVHLYAGLDGSDYDEMMATLIGVERIGRNDFASLMEESIRESAFTENRSSDKKNKHFRVEQIEVEVPSQGKKYRYAKKWDVMPSVKEVTSQQWEIPSSPALVVYKPEDVAKYAKGVVEEAMTKQEVEKVRFQRLYDSLTAFDSDECQYIFNLKESLKGKKRTVKMKKMLLDALYKKFDYLDQPIVHEILELMLGKKKQMALFNKIAGVSFEVYIGEQQSIGGVNEKSTMDEELDFISKTRLDLENVIDSLEFRTLWNSKGYEGIPTIESVASQLSRRPDKTISDYLKKAVPDIEIALRAGFSRPTPWMENVDKYIGVEESEFDREFYDQQIEDLQKQALETAEKEDSDLKEELLDDINKIETAQDKESSYSESEKILDESEQIVDPMVTDHDIEDDRYAESEADALNHSEMMDYISQFRDKIVGLMKRKAAIQADIEQKKAFLRFLNESAVPFLNKLSDIWLPVILPEADQRSAEIIDKIKEDNKKLKEEKKKERKINKQAIYDTVLQQIVAKHINDSPEMGIFINFGIEGKYSDEVDSALFREWVSVWYQQIVKGAAKDGDILDESYDYQKAFNDFEGDLLEDFQIQKVEKQKVSVQTMLQRLERRIARIDSLKKSIANLNKALTLTDKETAEVKNSIIQEIENYVAKTDNDLKIKKWMIDNIGDSFAHYKNPEALDELVRDMIESRRYFPIVRDRSNQAPTKKLERLSISMRIRFGLMRFWMGETEIQQRKQEHLDSILYNKIFKDPRFARGRESILLNVAEAVGFVESEKSIISQFHDYIQDYYVVNVAKGDKKLAKQWLEWTWAPFVERRTYSGDSISKSDVSLIGRGGPHWTEKEGKSFAIYYKRFHNEFNIPYSEADVKSWEQKRPPDAFWKYTPESVRAFILYVKHMVLEPSKEFAIRTGVFNDANLYIHWMNGYAPRMGSHPEKDTRSWQERLLTKRPTDLAREYRTEEEYRAESRGELTGASTGWVVEDDISRLVPLYIGNVMRKSAKNLLITEFGKLPNPDFPSVNLVTYSQDKDVRMLARGIRQEAGVSTEPPEEQTDEEVLSAKRWLETHDYVQARGAAALAYWKNGGFRVPYVHKSMLPMLKRLIASEDSSGLIRGFLAANRLQKSLVMFFPPTFLLQMLSPLWIQPKNIKFSDKIKRGLLPIVKAAVPTVVGSQVGAALGGVPGFILGTLAGSFVAAESRGLKQLAGKLKPWTLYEGWNPEVLSNAMLNNVQMLHTNSAYKVVMDRTMKYGMDIPQLQPFWERFQNWVGGKFGMDDYAFGDVIPKAIYTFYEALALEMMQRGMPYDAAWRRAAHVVNRTGGAMASFAFGREKEWLPLFLFATDFTVSELGVLYAGVAGGRKYLVMAYNDMLGQLFGTIPEPKKADLGFMRRYRVGPKGEPRATNPFVLAELTEEDFNATAPYFTRFIALSIFRLVIAKSMIQWALSFWDDDEERRGSLRLEHLINPAGHIWDIRTPWKDKYGQPVFLGFLGFKEAGNYTQYAAAFIPGVAKLTGKQDQLTAAWDLFKSKASWIMRFANMMYRGETLSGTRWQYPGAPLTDQAMRFVGATYEDVAPRFAISDEPNAFGAQTRHPLGRFATAYGMATGVNIRQGKNVNDYDLYLETQQEAGKNLYLTEKLRDEAYNIPDEKLTEWGRQSPYHARSAINELKRRRAPELKLYTGAKSKKMKNIVLESV